MGTQATVAKVFGVVLLIVGVLGFVPNPIVGDPGAAGEAQERTGAAEEGAIFGTNVLHNVVHLVSGAIAVWVGFFSDRPDEHSKTFNVAFGAVYAVVTLLGLLASDLMRDLLAVNTADNVLHLLIAVVLLAVGWTVDVEEPVPA